MEISLLPTKTTLLLCFALLAMSSCFESTESKDEVAKSDSSNKHVKPVQLDRPAAMAKQVDPCAHPVTLPSCSDDCESQTCQDELVNQHKIVTPTQINEYLQRRVGPSFTYRKNDVPTVLGEDCNKRFLMQISSTAVAEGTSWTISLSTIQPHAIANPIARVFPVALMKRILGDASLVEVTFSAVSKPAGCDEKYASILLTVLRKEGAAITQDYYDLSVPPDYSKLLDIKQLIKTTYPLTIVAEQKQEHLF